MAQYFAQIDSSSIVTRVIVASTTFIQSSLVGDPKTWIETAENSSMRKNFAGIGYQYNPSLDCFIPPKPFNSWVLDSVKGVYVPPIPIPSIKSVWDEATTSWKVV
jgi:hypothetical protein